MNTLLWKYNILIFMFVRNTIMQILLLFGEKIRAVKISLSRLNELFMGIVCLRRWTQLVFELPCGLIISQGPLKFIAIKTKVRRRAGNGELQTCPGETSCCYSNSASHGTLPTRRRRSWLAGTTNNVQRTILELEFGEILYPENQLNLTSWNTSMKSLTLNI